MHNFRKRLSVHLMYSWALYVIAAVVLIVFWKTLFGLLDRVPQEKQVNLFLAVPAAQTEKLSAKLEKALSGRGIRQVGVDYYSPADEKGFSLVFSTRGTVGTDLILLPEGSFLTENCESSFAPLSAAELKSYLPDGTAPDYYRQDGQIYGICVYDPAAPRQTLLTQYTDFTGGGTKKSTKYYLFISRTSDNAGGLTKKSASENTQALEALKTLLGGIS